MLAMTGRVTMLGISRWTEKGGSYRTVQRFFHTVIPWATMFWLFFQHHLYRSEDVYLLAGDECVVTKSGKHTHGLDRFFSSLYGKVVPSLEFFALSLVSLSERHSYPVMVEQVVRTAEEKAAAKAKAASQESKTKAEKERKTRPTERKQKPRQNASDIDTGVDTDTENGAKTVAAHRVHVSVAPLGDGWQVWQQQRPPNDPSMRSASDLQVTP